MANDTDNTATAQALTTAPCSRLVEVKNFDHPIHYGWGIYLDGEYVRLGQELEWIAKCLGVKYRPFAPSAQISDTIAQHVLERHGRSVFISENKEVRHD